MSTGGTRAAAAGPSTPAPRQPPRRKAVPENWDDDFEFAFPVKAKAATARPVVLKPQGLGLGLSESARSNENLTSKRSDSPDSFDEDWDEPARHPIAGPSRSHSGGLVFPSGPPSVMTTRSNSRSSRVNGGPAPTLLSLPRSSPSQSPTLPSPTASVTSGPPRRGHSAKTSAATMSSLRSAVGEGSGTPLRGVRKRSSASILKSESGGSLSMHSVSPAHKSSPSLVDPTVTPTPATPGRIRRSSLLPRSASPTKVVRPSPPKLPPKSASKSPAKPLAKQPPMPTQSAGQTHTPVKQQQYTAASPELRSTPSSEQLKKPNFWKRLSGGASKSPGRFLHRHDRSPSSPSPAHPPAVTPPRRPRSSSVGHQRGLPSDPDTPPVPPLPANLRTPSSGSGWSSASGFSSSMSSTSGSASKPGAVKRLSAMLRRSSGNLSKHKTPSPPHPPLPQPLHPYAMRGAHASASSVNMPHASASSVHVPIPSMSTTSVVTGTPSPAARLRSSASRSSLVPSNASMTYLSSANGSMTRLAASSNGSTVKLASSNGSTVKLVHAHNGSSSHLPGVPPTRQRTTSRPSPVALPSNTEPAPRTKFSPGFHLPNNAIGSPYRERAMAAPSHASPLAQDASDSDTETEENGGTTPRRRRIRPVSAQPAPRRPNGGLANGRFKEVNASVPVLPGPTSQPSMSSTSSQEPSSLGLSPTTTATSQTGSVASSHFGHTTLRRITSFSKKHSRRLSGGWKFGSVSSHSSAESKEAPPMAGVRQTLEPVAGSPSKPWDGNQGYDSKNASEASAAISKTLAALEARPKSEMASEIPNGNAANNTDVGSTSKHATTAPKTKSSRKGKAKPPVEKWDDWDDEPLVLNGQRRSRQHRRMSLNEFVIPDTVLAKQKELKRGIGAVKKFAGGVESLKGLVESHEKVCNHILANGTQDETKEFVTLENEYAQWWEMATVLIEVASTGTDGKESPDPEPRTRRITLATDDARAASEALRQVSGTSSNNTYTTATSSDYPDVFLAPNGGPPKASPPPDYYRASTGRHDLSKRQLEVLRTMLRTPVEASDSVVPSVEKRQTSFMSKRPKHQSMPAPAPATIHETPAPRNTHERSPENLGSYIMPSPTYPSPNTAAALAQPHPRHHKLGLAGLRDFLRSLKTRPSQTMAGPATPTKAPRNNPTGLPIKSSLKPRPPPINTETTAKAPESPAMPTSPSTGAADYASRRSGRFSPDKMGSKRFSPDKMDRKRRRPSIKNIFRTGSGTWTDIVRSPASPHAPANNLSRTSLVPHSAEETDPTPPTPTPKTNSSSGQPTGLPHAPSVPALSRLKSGKSDSYASLGVDSPTSSPTKSCHQELAAFPAAAGDSEATLRFKSRMRGLGHPSESSPSRTSSSPAQVPGAPSSELAPGVADETPRSRSDAGPRAGDDIVVALTPENLPVLLDYVRQCERRLDEWRQRAGSAGMLGVAV